LCKYFSRKLQKNAIFLRNLRLIEGSRPYQLVKHPPARFVATFGQLRQQLNSVGRQVESGRFHHNIPLLSPRSLARPAASGFFSSI
jgi:hypothetical protein